MACALTKQQVIDLYKVIYRRLYDRVNDSSLPKFDLDKTIKDFYNQLSEATQDPNKALLYAQALPEIFEIAAKDIEIRKYLRSINFDRNKLEDMIIKFDNQDEVKKFVAAPQKTREEIDEEIKQVNKAKHNQPPAEPLPKKIQWSYNENNGAKIAYPLATVGQQAYAINPETATEEEKNVKDPEKKLFYDVIQAIVGISRARTAESDEIIYQGKSLALTAIKDTDFPEDSITAADKKYLSKPDAKRGIIAAITDTNGDFIYFTEDGDITDNPDNGRIVYQYLRRVNLIKGKLYLSSESEKYITLVPAETLAKREAQKMIDAGVEVTDEQVQQMTKQIAEKQTNELNELYRLRQYINSEEGTPVVLPITGGTYGISTENTRTVSLQESGLSEEDVAQYQQITEGKKFKGQQFFTITQKKGGVEIDQNIFLQRGDMYDALADKIATVLTTNAKLLGKELTPEERRDYFKIFINNTTSDNYGGLNRDRITVNAVYRKMRLVLEVNVNGEVIPQEELYTEEAKQKIYNHLLNARPKEKIEGEFWPANIQFNNKYNGENFTEYNISGDTITEESKNYFDAIKPYIKIVFNTEAEKLNNGLNAYLTYKIPSELAAPGEVIYEAGLAQPKAETTATEKTSKPSEASYTYYGKYSDAKDAYKDKKGLWGLRPTKGLTPVVPFGEHFGNPWDVAEDALNKVKVVDKLEEAVQNYEDWLTGRKFKKTQQERRKWILSQIDSGALDNANFIYYNSRKTVKTHVHVLVDLINNRDKAKAPEIVEPAPVKVTKEERVEADKKILDLSSVLNMPSRTLYKREKIRQSFLDRVFTSKADLKKAEDWWSNSGLSQIKVDGKVLLPLETITEIVNSDAFAIFTENGITLYQADGGTSIDVYHEAWHGFSQMVLTNEQKTKLYEELRTVPKWANAEFFDIEEDIAEDFRSFMKSKKKFPGFLGRIFEAIGKLLRKLYGKITRQDMTRPRDIASVREYFDLLYKSDKNPEVFQQFSPSVNNIMFTKLKRSKTIEPVKAVAKNYSEFTLEESTKAARVIDSLIGIEFQNYNRDNNTTAGAVRILANPQNRSALYRSIRDRLERIRVAYAEAYEKVVLQNQEVEDPDFFLEQDIENKMMYFTKLVDNFGDIDLSLDGKQKTGVVAYHMKKSKFSAIKESYADLTEDPTDLDKSQMSKLDGGNTISSKDIASEETMMLLSSVFKAVRNKNGEIEQVTDEFGIPQLEDPNDMWNRLAKILEGSFDETEMYQRIVESSNNYPELYQLQNLLPNPYLLTPGSYTTNTEFDTETKFWQDLKKPRISYIQLNLTKDTEGDKAGKYEARLSKANFDVYKVVNDWSSNFITADNSVNSYIVEDNFNRNMLDTGKILEKFGNKELLSSSEALELLNALGIYLDTSSPAIMAIVNSKQKLFSNRFGINRILDVIRQVHNATDEGAANQFKRSPLTYLLNGLPYELRVDKAKNEEMRARIRVLAELQNLYSDSYSNFSVLSPERNRVWEHFLDSTITRVITSLRKAKNWEELTSDEADPNGIFKHMRWMAEENNTFTTFSKLLNSVFDLNPLSQNYGNKKPGADLMLNNVSGTQLVGKSYDETTGISTASMDGTSKFLQEFNTMLLNGIEEFMRHASKNTSMGLTVTNKIDTYQGKNSDKLYVDVEAFRPGSFGESKAFDIISGYISGEANRIFRFSSDIKKFAQFAGYNREVRRKDGRIVMAGQAFTAFDDVLSLNVQKELYAIIDNAVKNKQGDFNMMAVLNQDLDLRARVEQDVKDYFDKQTEKNQERLNKARYVDASLVNKADVKYIDLTASEVDNILVKAYSYNSWIHKFETAIIAYGDFAQYNHDKEEFHKRNAGLGSGGRGFRADLRAQAFVNNPALFKRYYADKMGYKTRKYDGTLHTAIIKEIELPSVMYDEYYQELEEVYFNRLGDRAEAKKLADIAMKEYKSMKIADGQGHISFETYRMLKRLEGNWTDAQERLYRKVALEENIGIEDVIEYFPPYKLQYFGNMQTTGLPITSFHKFSLAPIIPGVAKKGTPLYDMHQKMMEKKIDYVLFESGSKVGHIGSGDEVLNADGTFNNNVEFTKNIIFAEYLKNQTEVNQAYKKKSIFSTQMRKLILEGLYEKGVIETTDEDKITNPIVNKYLNDVSEYTDLLKLEFLEEIGYEEASPGEYVARDKNSMGKLVNIIRQNLEREDLLSDDLIEFIDVYENTGELVHDLSLHPDSGKIEKLLLSMINKRIIKQKVKGEPLVQVSSGLYENSFRTPANLKGATEADIKKWVGSNLLPTYHKKVIDLNSRYKDLSKEELENILKAKKRIQLEQSAYWTDRNKQSLRDEISHLEDRIAGRKPKITTTSDGSTAAMKVMIAMQGDYYNLFNLEYADGQTIGMFDQDGKLDMDKSLARLNEKIKDDAWLDADNGANRKAITMVGVRIPVQGLNSMEFMEVYEFLAPQAGNIIIPPAEIVAKSGGDFDIDKLTIFMTNLNSEGKIKQKLLANNQDVLKRMQELRESGESISQMFSEQKAGLENELIEDIRKILELPQNYASLITPNGTFILKSIAEDLAEDVMEYNPFENMMSEESNQSSPDKNGNSKKVISPTRVLETLYNIYKHESNIVGKKTLGLGAIENTYNVIMNAAGAYMPKQFGTQDEPRESLLFLRHNKDTDPNGNEVISISSRFDVDNKNKIADVISQMMNGWVDVEKDAWIFFIQGNYEVAPILLYLVKAGVPVKEAIYFVSNPLVRDYVNEQRMAKSTYADVLGKKPDSPNFAKYQAASEVIVKNFRSDELGKYSKNYDRYLLGKELSDQVLEDRAEDKKYFTENEMRNLISAYKKNTATDKQKDMAKAMFLHYLQVENQIGGLTQLKMNMNPDTSTKSTLSDVERTESNIENLRFDNRIQPGLLNSLMNDSVLKSFFNGELALAVSRPLFKLRYHKAISDYLIVKGQTLREAAESTFGENKVDTFVNTFRNDIVSFIFQNALRRYKLDDTYMSYNLKKEVPTKYAAELKRGAFVKTEADGTKTLYVDEKQLKQEFIDKAWAKNNEAENSYQDRGLYPLDLAAFMKNKKLNFNQYLRFVAEREYLRSEFPIGEVSETKYFKSQMKAVKQVNPDLANEKVARFTYEKYLAEKALENTFNIHYMFKNKDTALAVKYSDFLTNNKDLASTYRVLNSLRLDTNQDDSTFNVYLADKELNNEKATEYTKNLADLSNVNVKKVSDPEENARISDLFSKLSLFAFMQTGLNKSKLSFTSIANYNDFLQVVERESEMFQKALDKNGNAILDNFFNLFMEQNNVYNKDKNRYKDYLSTLDYGDLGKVAGLTATTEKRRSAQITKTIIADKPVINIYWGSPESSTNTKVLSNLAPRKFTYQGKEYGSVEHAYQTLKSGSFDQATYDKYVKAGGYGTKIRGKAVQKGFDNLQLMKDLVVESFKQNPNQAALLLNYSNFTHTTNEVIDKAFLEGVRLAQKNAKPTTSEEVTAEPVSFQRSGLKQTLNPNVFTYASTNKATDYYEDLTTKNGDVVFVYNTTVKELDKKSVTVFAGQSAIGRVSPDMSINIPTSLNNPDDSHSLTSDTVYKSLLDLFERRIQAIKELADSDIKIAFPESGFGNPSKMPQELFVYLSRRLYEEFGYLNPGSTVYEELREIVGNTQGISDEEILQQLGLEEDPFKC